VALIDTPGRIYEMTPTEIDDSQRKAAKIAGLAGLLPLPLVVFANFAVHDRLIIAGNLAQTAQNIVANETLFRASIVCDLLYSAGLIVLLSALYVILTPVSRTLSLLAAFWRLVYALIWLRMSLNLFDALRLFKGADYLQAIGTDRLQALAKVYLNARFDQYYVGLLFWALAAIVCSYLLLKSDYIPTALAGFGVIASLWCAACTMTFLVVPDFDKAVNLWWFDTPITLFEVATSVWLLIKGLRPPTIANARLVAA